jgi:predicted nucleotidyltransferase
VIEHRPVKYSDERFKFIAEPNTIILGQVGSGLHGVTIPGTDDRDEMGICIEPPQFVIGNEKLDGKAFEQYQYRTQPDGVRSGPGDLDLIIYSLRKWAKLAANGNPTVLLTLFTPEQELVTQTPIGEELQGMSDMFLSQHAAHRFLGYLDSQRQKVLGNRSNYTNRPELIDEFGFDTKFAYHAVRLGIQCVEMVETGRITLPIPEPDRTWLLELREGKHTLAEALDRMAQSEARVHAAILAEQLRPEPDRKAIDRWLTDTYLAYWDQAGML